MECPANDGGSSPKRKHADTVAAHVSPSQAVVAPDSQQSISSHVVSDSQVSYAIHSVPSVSLQLSIGSLAIPDSQATQAVNETQFLGPATQRPRVVSNPPQPKRRRTVQLERTGLTRNLQTLSSTAPRCYFDCACQVIGVFDYGEHVCLRVWDGTRPRKG